MAINWKKIGAMGAIAAVTLYFTAEPVYDWISWRLMSPHEQAIRIMADLVACDPNNENNFPMEYAYVKSSENNLTEEEFEHSYIPIMWAIKQSPYRGEYCMKIQPKMDWERNYFQTVLTMNAH